LENLTISGNSDLWTLVKARVRFLVCLKVRSIDIQTSYRAFPLESQTLLGWEGGGHLGTSVSITSITGRFGFGGGRSGFPTESKK